MNKLARFFYRYLYWLVPWWYGLTMTLTRKRRYPEVDVYQSVQDIAVTLDWGKGWRPDPVKQVLDVMMSPRKFQRNIDQDLPLGDCDDHAIYWATALLKSGLAKRAFLGTVWYAAPGKRGNGHVVCLYEDFERRLFWTDYGLPWRFKGDDWALDVATKRGKLPLAYGMVEVKLRDSGEPRLVKRVRSEVV